MSRLLDLLALFRKSTPNWSSPRSRKHQITIVRADGIQARKVFVQDDAGFDAAGDIITALQELGLVKGISFVHQTGPTRVDLSI